MTPNSRLPIDDAMFVSPNKKWTFEELLDPKNMEISCRQAAERSNRDAMVQVNALMAAKWQMEVVSESATDPWQWAWRRPGKRPGKPGRRFASTNQAYMALMREKNK